MMKTHHLRAAARLMKQKADHHLTFLADKNDRSATNILKHLPSRHASIAPSTSAPSRANNDGTKRAGPATHASTAANERNGHADGTGIQEEDAAGESDDGVGESEGVDFRNGAKMGEGKFESGENQLPECESPRRPSLECSTQS
jgi:transcriptional activator SPT7